MFRCAADRLGRAAGTGRRRLPAVAALLVSACLALGCDGQSQSSWSPSPSTIGGLRVLARSGAAGFALLTSGGERHFMAGVNLGSTTPGHQPGEVAITAADCRRWFAQMGELGVRALRIYTILPPHFYTELAAYNTANRDRPLYLFHGVYLPDESYIGKGNLYDPVVTDTFTAELRDASAAVSGNLQRGPTPGRASGTWTTDVSPWLAGWLIGVEWDPGAVLATDEANRQKPAHSGRYFASTPLASPTERWLAARMDELATAEAARGRSVPLAFLNWVTTDPLRHPHEPNPAEDLVGVDANHIRATVAWPGGTFASYHAYPYYPDFFRYEFEGNPDPYAAYLDVLRRHHPTMPVLITEFGVPSSLGSAHSGPLGRDQGGHSERHAMELDAELLRVIQRQGLAGGFVFAWTDEWFKLTWNTMTHQIPAQRRRLWHDPLTNEQYFGVVATDPVGGPGAAPVTRVDDPSGKPARRVTTRLDESFLHLQITLADPAPARLTIGLDPLPYLTGEPPPGSVDTRADAAFALDLDARTGQAWIRAELDPVPLDLQVADSDRPPAVGGWRHYQLVTNRAFTVPLTGQQQPVELFDVGRLHHGTLDPTAAGADSRAMWFRDGSTIEVRVPWALAGFSDPSSLQVLVPKGVEATSATSPGVAVTLWADGSGQSAGTVTWEPWQQVHYAERVKPGAEELREAFTETAK